MIEGPNARDQIAFYAFRSLLAGNPFQKNSQWTTYIKESFLELWPGNI